jgi:hypothetical protein
MHYCCGEEVSPEEVSSEEDNNEENDEEGEKEGYSYSVEISLPVYTCSSCKKGKKRLADSPVSPNPRKRVKNDAGEE